MVRPPREKGKRLTFLQSFVECVKNGAGDDKDGDGKRWCEDCRDDNPAVHPGAPEILRQRRRRGLQRRG